MNTGAVGYILKSTTLDRPIEAVGQALDAYQPIDPKIAKFLMVAKTHPPLI